MRYFVTLIFIGYIFLGLSPVFAEDSSDAQLPQVELPKADDLSTLAVSVIKQRLPILLMYSAEDCEYCERLEEDLIRPMLRSGELSKRVIFRKVMVDSMGTIKDFKGHEVEPDVFAYGKGVQVTPTLQFVDENGEELVPKIIGYQSVDLFSAYLDQAIGGSTTILHKR